MTTNSTNPEYLRLLDMVGQNPLCVELIDHGALWMMEPEDIEAEYGHEVAALLTLRGIAAEWMLFGMWSPVRDQRMGELLDRIAAGERVF